MITARGEELDRVLGLEIGADDYITKPFSVRELKARIKAVLRRTQQGGEAEPFTLLRGPGNLLMDVECRSVVVGETSVELTRLEFDLLHRLLINPGRVLTRERLLEQAWGYEYVGDTRAVDSAVKSVCVPNSAPLLPKLIASNQCAGWAIGSTDMQTIRTRLSLNYLIVLLLGMSLAGVLAWLAVSKLYVDTQRENLLAQPKLIAAGLGDSTLPTQPAEPYLQTSNVLPGIHTRLIVDRRSRRRIAFSMEGRTVARIYSGGSTAADLLPAPA